MLSCVRLRPLGLYGYKGLSFDYDSIVNSYMQYNPVIVKSKEPTSLSAISIPLNLLIYFQPCMLVIPLILLGCQITICCPSICLHFVWRPQLWRCSSYNLEFSPFSPQNVYQPWHLPPIRHHLKTNYFQQAFLLRPPQIWLWLTIVRVYKLHLLTYFTYFFRVT